MFQPTTPEPDDERIISYLLGAPDERLDELAVADDNFAARLAAAENDLVDAYVRGELSRESRERFESSYLTSERRREKASFAEAFLLWSRAIPAPADARRWPHGRWPVPRWALGLAACLALLVSGGLLYRSQRLHERVAKFRAASATSEQGGPKSQNQIEAQPSASAPRSLESAPDERQKGAQRPRSQSLVALVLLPQTRGIVSPPTLRLEPRGEDAAFRLELESDESPAYRVTLKDQATNLPVWESGTLKGEMHGGSPSVTASLPWSLLKPQDYNFELSGTAPDGSPDLIGSYAFRVVIR
ncbi:MAG: hypothetical protein ABSH56_24570 [Bryobacteraceae bacterium]|jgi:hypothetical protein